MPALSNSVSESLDNLSKQTINLALTRLAKNIVDFVQETLAHDEYGFAENGVREADNSFTVTSFLSFYFDSSKAILTYGKFKEEIKNTSDEKEYKILVKRVKDFLDQYVEITEISRIQSFYKTLNEIYAEAIIHSATSICPNDLKHELNQVRGDTTAQDSEIEATEIALAKFRKAKELNEERSNEIEKGKAKEAKDNFIITLGGFKEDGETLNALRTAMREVGENSIKIIVNSSSALITKILITQDSCAFDYSYIDQEVTDDSIVDYIENLESKTNPNYDDLLNKTFLENLEEAVNNLTSRVDKTTEELLGE